MPFRILVITVLVALQPVLGQTATQPATQPETQPVAPAEEIKLPQLTDKQRDKLSDLWESLFSSDDKEAAEKARRSIIEEKNLAAAFLYEQFVEARLDGEAAAKLIADLDSDVWKTRDAATEKLKADGISQADLLEMAKSSMSKEAAGRLGEIQEFYAIQVRAALEILISMNTDISWETARAIANAGKDAGNRIFIGRLVDEFISDIAKAAGLVNYYTINGDPASGFEIYPKFDEEMVLTPSEEEITCWLTVLLQRLNVQSEKWKYDYYYDIPLWDIAVRLTPNNPECYLGRAEAYNNRRETDEAEKDFTRAVELAPGEIKYLLERGRFYLNLRYNKDALADFNKAVELKPDDDRSRYWRAITFFRVDKTDEAIADLNRAVELKPDCAWYYEELANIYESLKENEKFLKNLDLAIKYDKDINYNLYYRRAGFYKKQGRLAEYVADMKMAVATGSRGQFLMIDYSHYVDPVHVWCNELAWFLLTTEDASLRDVKDALSHAMKACDVKPIYILPSHLNTLACAYAENGQWDMAIKTQKDAVNYAKDENQKNEWTQRLEGFKNHKTYLQQEADKKQQANPQSRPESQPETQPDTQPATMPAE